jgi:Mn2+/Fe2+ NRAMP family transporter
LVKEAGKVMDKFTQIAGFVMIVLTVYVAISSNPPVGEAVAKTFMPDKIDMMSIVTLIGGTVGGYITFSGGHRLVDAGVTGIDALPQITRSSVTGVCVTGVMRVVLFLATLGVLSAGMTLDPANPPASVFKLAAGNTGYKIFGVVMWAAAISSVIGAAYTSVSFIRSFSASLDKNYRWLVIAFIVFSTFIFAVVGRPVKILILVGTLNGLILPITLGVMLIAAYKKNIVGDYKHPAWMTIFGVIVVAMTAYMGVITLTKQLPKLLS